MDLNIYEYIFSIQYSLCCELIMFGYNETFFCIFRCSLFILFYFISLVIFFIVFFSFLVSFFFFFFFLISKLNCSLNTFDEKYFFYFANNFAHTYDENKNIRIDLKNWLHLFQIHYINAMELEPILLFCFVLFSSQFLLSELILSNIKFKIRQPNIVLVTLYLIRTFHIERKIKLNFHSQNRKSREKKV